MGSSFAYLLLTETPDLLDLGEMDLTIGLLSFFAFFSFFFSAF